MEGNGDMFRASPVAGSSSSSSSSNSRRYRFPSASSIIQAPLSVLLEYSGILPPRTNQQHQPNPNSVPNVDGEVSIRIIGSAEQEHNHREEESSPVVANDASGAVGMTSLPLQGDVEGVSRTGSGNSDAEAGGGDGAGPNRRDSSYQRYVIQHAVRWIEHVFAVFLASLVRLHSPAFARLMELQGAHAYPIHGEYSFYKGVQYFPNAE